MIVADARTLPSPIQDAWMAWTRNDRLLVVFITAGEASPSWTHDARWTIVDPRAGTTMPL